LAFLKNISPGGHSDAELLSRFKESRDLAVLGELYQRYMDLVYGVCLKYLKQPENAQDSTLSIFEELVVKLQKHEVDNFKSWLYTLAKNHCLMRLRSEKKAPVVDFDVELMQSQENGHLNGESREEQFVIMEDCLSRLPEAQRKAIDLFYLQGKCYNEISALTGMEWNKVRSFIQNGRRNLKLCMERQQEKSEKQHVSVVKK
jgi:RNA polymerase sigma factor (sigma-70 family)